MDSSTRYQDIIKRLLRERQAISFRRLPEGLEVTCLFDDVSRQHALLSVGWMQVERVSGAILPLRIKNDKIWIEDDGTDAAIADDLIAEGIPAEKIVLTFHSPETRHETEFAVA